MGSINPMQRQVQNNYPAVSGLLTSDQVDAFFDENSAEIASFASKSPDQWLQFSRKVKNALPANQDNTAIAARLDRLNGIAARLLKIESRSFTPFTQDALQQARSMPKELILLIHNATLNIRSPDSILEAIERMKLLSVCQGDDTVVFGSIKVEAFADWVKEHKIQFKDLPLNLADRNTLIPHLEYLNLDEMRNKDELESILSSASSVQELKVILCKRNNHSNLLAQLPNPEGLESLIIRGKGLGLDINIDSLSQFPNLKKLNVSYSNIQDYHFNRKDIILPQFDTLETLNLSGNPFISSRSFEFFKHSSHLKCINLYDCYFSDQALKSLHYFPDLETLILGKNPISDEALETITSLENLTDLRLSDTPITDSGLQKLKSLRHLTTLNLNRTPISGIGFAGWESAPIMRTLWLNYCPHLSAANLKQIKSFRQLQVLSIQGCANLSEAVLAQFQEEMQIPDLSFRW